MPLTSEQKKLYKLIDEILWNDWDPIGINDTEEARDEYQSYTPQIFSFRINNSDIETIAQHLYNIETERMGLFGGLQKCRQVAEKIIATSV
jgi:hypothetical protein